MKKLFLLALVFALVALPMVMAADLTGRAIGDYCDGNTICTSGVCDLQTHQCAVPEFTTIGAGIAITGAGVAYWFIRSRKK